MYQYIKKLLTSIPNVFIARNVLRNITGHYYSPLPSFKEINQREKEVFTKKAPAGVDLNLENQLEKLRYFSEMQDHPPFYHKKKRKRFNIDNDSFSYDDAPVLHYMMRLLKPSRVIEVGCGNSSACMLDTNDLYLDGKVKFTFIDVDLKVLREMLRDTDYDKVTLFENRIQDVNLEIFRTLETNDILFIDSSHVTKIGSDLNIILFDILPLINPGVHIHFHDIRYPFQYTDDDLKQRIYWNEAYILRAFLQYNELFKITFWLNYLLNSDVPAIKELTLFLPLDDWAQKFRPDGNTDDYADAGGSVWLTKV